MRDSRVQGTQHAGDCRCRILSPEPDSRASSSAASAIGYYGNRGDEVLTEASSPGEGFLADVSQAWEAATNPAREAGLRVVNMRIGVVLAHDGGALKPMLPALQLGLGGRIGDGRQYWSWVSLDDVVGAILFALENDKLRGPVNVVAPQPASQCRIRARTRPRAASARDPSSAGLGAYVPCWARWARRCCWARHG